MDHTPSVSIVVPTYNRANLLRETLASLTQHKHSIQELELLVIDNASTDETKEEVLRFSDAPLKPKYIHEAVQGLDHARNRGVYEAMGEIIVYVDDDVLVGERWLDTLIEPWKNHLSRKIGAVGGTVVPVFPEGYPEWMEGWAKPLKHGEIAACLEAGKYPMGANVAFHRDVFHRVGKFRTDLDRKGKSLLSGGETEFMRRLRDADWEVWFAPHAVLEHQFPRSRMNLAYACRHAFDSARSRVLDWMSRTCSGGFAAAAYGLSRITGHFFKGIAIGIWMLLCLLCLQFNPAKKSLVRLCRCGGYLYEIPRSFHRRLFG